MAAAVLRRWFVLPVPLALLPDIGRVVDTAEAQVEVPLRGRLLPGDGGHVGLVVVIVGINIASVDMGGEGSVVSMPMTAVGRGTRTLFIWDEMRNEVWKNKKIRRVPNKEEGETDAGTIHPWPRNVGR